MMDEDFTKNTRAWRDMFLTRGKNSERIDGAIPG